MENHTNGHGRKQVYSTWVICTKACSASPDPIAIPYWPMSRVQHRLSGPGASALLSKITPTSTESLKPNHSTLSCLLHPGTGGIVDDTVITRLTSSPDAFYMVTNAACRDKDIAYISAQIKELGASVKWDILDHWGLVALQGPLSAGILHDLVWELRFYLPKLHFGQCIELPLRLSPSEWSPPVLVSRGGYTGEDGFEISIPPDATVAVTDALLKSAGPEKLRLAGLGARDSLRLEAGMCLYGHDLDDTTTPVEAGLAWIVSRERRASGGFHGAEVILDQLTPRKEGGTVVSRRRVGLIVQGPPAREGAEIVAEDGTPVGKVTSGCPSPTLGRNIAMGYVKHGMTQAGTKLGVVVRGKQRDAEVVKMPFVQTRYWRGAAGTAPGWKFVRERRSEPIHGKRMALCIRFGHRITTWFITSCVKYECLSNYV